MMIYNPRTPNGLKKPMKGVKYTHEELQQAIRKFKQNGGLIQKLPDQKSLSERCVRVNYQNRVEEPFFEEAY